MENVNHEIKLKSNIEESETAPHYPTYKTLRLWLDKVCPVIDCRDYDTYREKKTVLSKRKKYYKEYINYLDNFENEE